MGRIMIRTKIYYSLKEMIHEDIKEHKEVSTEYFNEISNKEAVQRVLYDLYKARMNLMVAVDKLEELANGKID